MENVIYDVLPLQSSFVTARQEDCPTFLFFSCQATRCSLLFKIHRYIDYVHIMKYFLSKRNIVKGIECSEQNNRT